MAAEEMKKNVEKLDELEEALTKARDELMVGHRIRFEDSVIFAWVQIKWQCACDVILSTCGW